MTTTDTTPDIAKLGAAEDALQRALNELDRIPAKERPETHRWPNSNVSSTNSTTHSTASRSD